jgi:hypothetical protein
MRTAATSVASSAAATQSIIFRYCGSMAPGPAYFGAGMSVTIVERSMGKYFRKAS